jgi:hypothetical protein
VISAEKIIPGARMDQAVRRTGRSIRWFNYVAGYEIATISRCSTLFAIVIFLVPTVLVVVFRSGTSSSNSNSQDLLRGRSDEVLKSCDRVRRGSRYSS